MPGSLVSPTAGGTINWEPPAFSPDTGLFYTAEGNGYSIFYLTDVDPRGSMGLGGKEEVRVGTGGTYLTAIDYKTGRSPGGILITATAAAADCWPPRADCCSRATARATWWRTTPRPASRSGTRASAASRTRRRPSCWTAVNT